MAVSADSVVVDVIANVAKASADMRGYASSVEQSTARVDSAVKRSADVISLNTARSANATRNLGRQISDIGVGLAGGQSPFLILAQQAPQVADALADTGGKAARVAAFFAGPWGAALLAAGSIAGVLAGKIFETGEAGKGARSGLDAYSNSLADLQSRAEKATDALRGLNETASSARVANIGKANIDALLAEGQAAQKQAEIDRLRLTTGGRAANFGGNDANQVRIDVLKKERDAFQDVADQRRLELRLLTQNDAKIRASEASRDSETKSVRASAAAHVDRAKALETEAEKLARLRKEDEESSRARVQATAEILNRPGGISDTINVADDSIKARADASGRQFESGINKAFDQGEERTRQLADLFENAFVGGSGDIWDTFKREGLKTLALLLAKFVVLQSTQGGGGFGNILGNLGSAASSTGSGFSSLFGAGFASGGYGAPHSIHRVNETAGGVELLRMGSQGGEVIPLGRSGAVKGGATTILSAPQFNLRGAVITRELYADMERISARSATQAASAMGKRVLAATPSRVEAFTTDGT